MKKIISMLIVLLLLAMLAVPALATEATEPTATEAVAEPNPNGSHIMAVICLVIVIGGILYLTIGLKKSKQV